MPERITIPILMSTPLVGPTMTGAKKNTRRLPGPVQDRTYARARDALAEGREVWLWVRETWRIAGGAKRADERRALSRGLLTRDELQYRADEEWCHGAGWRPSIHMPRWGARIWLRLAEVRQERLSAISDADALAEGVVEVYHTGAYGLYRTFGGRWFRNPSEAFVSGFRIFAKLPPDADPLLWVLRWDPEQTTTTGCPWGEDE